MWTIRAPLAVLCVAALTAGCGNEQPELRVAPSAVTPGSEVGVTLVAPNHDAMTESSAILEKAVGESWEPTYLLTSDAARGARALAIPPGGPPPSTLGVGIDEDAVQLLELPSDLPAGRYRIVKSVSDLGADMQFDARVRRSVRIHRLTPVPLGLGVLPRYLSRNA